MSSWLYCSQQNKCKKGRKRAVLPFRVNETRQPGEAVHLGEGKLWYQASAGVRSYPVTEMASGVNLKEKSGVGVSKAVRGCIQPLPGNSCDVAETKRIGSCLYRGPFLRRGLWRAVQHWNTGLGFYTVISVYLSRRLFHCLSLCVTLSAGIAVCGRHVFVVSAKAAFWATACRCFLSESSCVTHISKSSIVSM